MRPRKPDGSSWNHEDSNAVLQHLSREATRELSARDVARGLPKSLATGAYDRSGVYRINERWSRIKHSGEEKTNLLMQRWQAFCAEPRDPQSELGKIGLTASPVEPSPMAGVGPMVQAAIAAGIQAGLAAAPGNGQAESKRGRKLDPVEETQ
ncbi:MAG: hypothetical protein Q7R41_08215 [Phycisphaerales bacterium]|nr:hypothetical protein [Phycisphaerales bacterium]